MSKAKAVLNGLKETLEAVVTSRVVTSCGESYTVVNDLSVDGRVQIGADPQDLHGDAAVAIHPGASSSERSGAAALGGKMRRFELHVFGVAAADRDDPTERVFAALDLDADLLACIEDDRNQGVRLGAVSGLANIDVTSSTADGGSEFEGRGVVYLLVVVRWSTMTGQ